MVEKEKFSKELDKNIKMLLQDRYLSFLSKLFKLAYETPYVSKVDYGSVQLVDFFIFFFSYMLMVFHKAFVANTWKTVEEAVNFSDEFCYFSDF